MDIKPYKSNIIKLFPNDNKKIENLARTTAFSDPAPKSKTDELRDEILINTSLAAHDLKKIKTQLLQLIKIMRRRKYFNETK